MEKEIATFAGGCFWCMEAIFKRLKGVSSVLSGYAGGYVDNPAYEIVSSGNTGHAEAIQIKFDPAIIAYEALLEVFWHLHDPTTRDRQGADVGTEYRSIIFYHNKSQRKSAESSKQKVSKKGTYNDPIVTEIIPYTNFFIAENKHQNFYENNPSYGYCRIVIDPKIQKLYKDYKHLVTQQSSKV